MSGVPAGSELITLLPDMPTHMSPLSAGGPPVAPASTRMPLSVNEPGLAIVLPVTVRFMFELPSFELRKIPYGFANWNTLLLVTAAVVTPAPLLMTLIPEPLSEPESTSPAVPTVLPLIVPIIDAA